MGFRNYGEKERQAAARKAHIWAKKRDAEIRAPYVGSDPVVRAAYKAGGVLILAKISMVYGENGGCGAPIHVEGTNGGVIPCGAVLNDGGEAKPYHCVHCGPKSEPGNEPQ